MSSLSPLAVEAWIRRYQRSGKPYGNYFGVYRFPDELGRAARRVNLRTRDKRVAERRLRELIQEEHAVREGLKPSRERVEAARRPLVEYIAEYVRERRGEPLSGDYLRKLAERLPALIEACAWERPADISAASFKSWRGARADLAMKTRNEYLAAARQFTDWLVERGALTENDLRRVKPGKATRQTRPRRPLTPAELGALIEATPSRERRMLYLTAAYTGGRRGELRQLRWFDIGRDARGAFVMFRAEVSKNGQEQRVDIPTGLWDDLAEYRSGTAEASNVFPSGLGTHTFNEDLGRAGIAKLDALNRSACFHSLRHTYNQLLAEADVPFLKQKRLMRHANPRLTSNTYLDGEAMSAADLDRVPYVGARGDRARCTVEADAERLCVSSDDATPDSHDGAQVLVGARVSDDLSWSDVESQNTDLNGAGGNRTPVPR